MLLHISTAGRQNLSWSIEAIQSFGWRTSSPHLFFFTQLDCFCPKAMPKTRTVRVSVRPALSASQAGQCSRGRGGGPGGGRQGRSGGRGRGQGSGHTICQQQTSLSAIDASSQGRNQPEDTTQDTDLLAQNTESESSVATIPLLNRLLEVIRTEIHRTTGETNTDTPPLAPQTTTSHTPPTSQPLELPPTPSLPCSSGS